MIIKIKIFILFLFMAVAVETTIGQTVAVLAQGHNASLRGLCVVNDRVIWASGSNGTVAQSLDSGKTWKWLTVNGFEKSEFRDIEAFDETSAVIMATSEPACILRTSDAGNTWKVVFEDTSKGMFLDAMEFWNEMSGIVIGDPVNNKIFIARSFNGGFTWRTLPLNNYPVAVPGEALFAASGTNIRKLNKQEAVFVTGGAKSRMFIRDKKIDLPIAQGNESTGANSIAVKDSKTMIIVGGDYTGKDSAANNSIITRDGGNSFTRPAKPPHGYLSCVEFIDHHEWICCGPGGVYGSTDDGLTWTKLSAEGFHVCRKAKDGNAVFFAGANGRIGKLKR